MILGIELKEFIIEVVLSVIVLAVSTVLGIMSDKYTKTKKTSYTLLNYIDIIESIMPDIMNKYETIFRNGNGDKKKELVMNELVAYCIEHKIDYSSDVLSDAVDNYCKVSKTINKGK